MKSLRYNLNSAIDIILQDGWGAFFRRVVRDFFGIVPEKNYLYKHTISERDAKQFMPRLDNYESFFLRDTHDFEKLLADGYKLGTRKNGIQIALNHKAVVFCVFFDKNLVHTGRLSTTKEGKDFVDSRPFSVDFNGREACTGNTWTLPSFRSKGLMKYGYYQRFEYLRSLGITTSRNSVETSNIASQRVHAKFNPEIYAEASMRRVLFFMKFWKEQPYKPS